jgi:hypothetical protein
VHLTLATRTNVGVSKNDQLKVLVVPSILPIFLVFIKEVFLLSLVVGI